MERSVPSIRLLYPEERRGTDAEALRTRSEQCGVRDLRQRPLFGSRLLQIQRFAATAGDGYRVPKDSQPVSQKRKGIRRKNDFINLDILKTFASILNIKQNYLNSIN